MAALTDAGVDVEILEGLEFDPELACEATTPACGRSAEWACRCRRCGFTVLFCVPCRVIFESHVARVMGLYFVSCARCGASAFRPEQIDGLIQWIPLRGAS